jgi:hypothetical protein
MNIPPAGALNVDHVAHFVPDMDAASAALERLGFTPTPFSAQSHRLSADGPLVPAGTGNRCVMLESGYLEFLTPTGDTPVADQLRAAISRYVGVHLIAFGTGAPQDDHARLAAAGYDPLPPVALQRPISTTGSEATARFTVVRVPPGRMAEGRIQFCQHHTPELLWQPRWLAHPNGARALATLLVCVTEPREAAQRYSRFTGIACSGEGNEWRLDTARGSVIFARADAFERLLGFGPPALPWIAGYVLETQDLARTTTSLKQGGFEISHVGGRIALALPPELGGALLFQQPRAGMLQLG